MVTCRQNGETCSPNCSLHGLGECALAFKPIPIVVMRILKTEPCPKPEDFKESSLCFLPG
ncbi:hypothetical protein KW797_03550 [Candidatus Parcubacteria bacterium]|nr:hypothetical protein [Candidatus Parcubacteria bacterium]